MSSCLKLVMIICYDNLVNVIYLNIIIPLKFSLPERSNEKSYCSVGFINDGLI